MTNDTLTTLFDAALEKGASDIHLVPEQPPAFRVRGELVRDPAATALTSEMLESLLLPAFPAPIRSEVQTKVLPTAEVIVTHAEYNFVIFVYRASGALAATVRIMTAALPTLEQVGGDQVALFQELAQLPSGLILLTGPMGSGKQTTAYSLLGEISQKLPRRIYMIEESLAIRVPSDQGLVTSLLIGQDVPDYESAAQLLFRGADPDVVYFADLPTAETVRHAFTLVRTGHLVIATVTAQSAAEAVTTLCRAAPTSFPELLAQNLTVAINQRLLPRAKRKGRVPAYEVLRNTTVVRELLRANPTPDSLLAVMESASDMRTMRHALADLVTAGEVTAEAAQAVA